jgi:hypothetical protein
MLLKSTMATNGVLRVGIVMAIIWALGMNLLNYLDPSAILPGPNNTLNAEEFGRRAFVLEKSVVFERGMGIFTMNSIPFLASLGTFASMLWLWKKRFNPGLPASVSFPSKAT